MTSADKTVSAEVWRARRRAPSPAVRWLGPIAVGIALFSALLTFLVLDRADPHRRRRIRSWSASCSANALAALLLVAVIGREVWMIIQARRRGRAAAQLHVSIVGLFSVIAAVPAILVAIVASITLDRGLDRIFNIRTRAVIENSLLRSRKPICATMRRSFAATSSPSRPTSRAPSRFSIRTGIASGNF